MDVLALIEPLQRTIITPLQPHLSPLIAALPAPVHDALITLIGPDCHRTLVLDLDATSTTTATLTSPAVPCLPLAVSKAAGLAIVSASATVKLPQLAKLAAARSGAGVSVAGTALETASLLITFAYGVRAGFPFSTYGEAALIAAQDVAVAVLVLAFARQRGAAAVFVAAVIAVVYALLGTSNGEAVVDGRVLGYLQAGAGALSVASKAPQIYTVWRQGSTGQLSAFAVFSYLAGSLVRIFTTLQEVDDLLVLYGYLAGFALNLILATQMAYYWNSGKNLQKKPGKKQVGKSKKAVNGGAAASSTPAKAEASGANTGRRTPTTRRRG